MDSSGSKRILACIRCGEKRIKCDRRNPCSACIKHNSTCEYRLRKPRVKRATAQHGTNGDTVIQKEATGLAGLDSIGSRHQDEPKDDPSAQEPPSEETDEQPLGSEPQLTVFKPQLLQGQDSTSLVNNSLWSRVAEEVHSEDDSAEDAMPNGNSHHTIAQDDFAYTLGCFNTTISRHPPKDQIRQLWQIFVDNVDPLLKITHVPSLKPAIEKAISDLEHVPRPFESLMFSMYSMAVLSIRDDQCRKMTGQSRTDALEHFIGATRSALLRARFMSSTSLVVMQALTLHIFSIRQSHEPRAVWNLTGLAFRVAQGMGLGIDGTLLGLSPFETEMRRRLWWQLKSHDFRAAELCGQAKFQQMELDETTPKAPANVNDADLFPTMTKPPIESTKTTEMCWNVLRTELVTFASYLKFQKKSMKKSDQETGFTSEEYTALDDLKSKDKLSDEIEELLETKYLRFCDPAKPLQLLMHLGARSATNHIRFIAHHPRRWKHQKEVSESEKSLVWNLGLQILDRTVMIQSLPQIQRFAWITPYYIQWPVVIHILDTLRIEPDHQEAEKAWQVIDSLYELNIEMLLMKRPIFAAVGKLCLKAYDVRTVSKSLETPEYIIKLQQRHQKSRDKGKRLGAIVHSSHVEQPPSLAPASIQRQDQDFWLDDNLDWLTANGTPDTLDMDIDLNGFLNPDDWLHNSQGAAINWDQWDAWLGNTQAPV